MVYEIDFELPVYDGGNCALRFSPAVALQGDPIDFLKGSYEEMLPRLGEQLARLKKAGEDFKIYVNGDFVDLSRSPVLNGIGVTKGCLCDFATDFMNMKRSPVLRALRRWDRKKVKANSDN